MQDGEREPAKKIFAAHFRAARAHKKTGPARGPFFISFVRQFAAKIFRRYRFAGLLRYHSASTALAM